MIELMNEKLKEWNRLIGGEYFWITEDENEYALETSECMFYNYCSPEQLIGFLDGMMVATKLGYRRGLLG